MTDWASAAGANIVAALAGMGDPARREPMAAYMKHHFEFLGIAAPVRERLTRPIFKVLPKPTAADAIAFAEMMWELPSGSTSTSAWGCSTVTRSSWVPRRWSRWNG